MALDIGTLVAKVTVDDGDFDKKTDSWSTKGGAVASAFGNLAANAISTVTTQLMDFVGEAATASDNTQKFAKTLEFAGVDGKNIDVLKKKTQAYADDTVYSLSDIQSITAQLASNGVKGYDTLAMSLGNLNAVAGGNSETFGRVGMVLTQTAGAGKLTTENWNQLAEAIPGASGPLQDALKKAGAYTGNFRDAMAQGQITSEEFNAAIQQVGNKPVAVEAAKSVETFEGAQGNLAAAIQSQLVVALDIVKPAFTGLQNALAWFISNSGLLVPVLSGIGVALLVVLAPAIWAAVTATWAFTVALLANPLTWIVIAIVALVAAIVWLIQNWDVATKFMTDVWQGFVSWFTGIVDGLVSWWTGVWNGFISWTQGVFAGFMSWWTPFWNGVIAVFTGIWEFIKGYVMTIVGVIVGIFTGNFSLVPGVIRDIWNKAMQFTQDVWNNILNWLKSIPGWVAGIFTGAGQWLYNVGKDIINGMWKGIQDMWGNVTRWIHGLFNGFIDTIKGILGIHSPSLVMRYEIMGNVGKGAILGLQDYEDDFKKAYKEAFSIPADTGFSNGGYPTPENGMVGSGDTKVVNLTMPAGATTEEAIYEALGTGRVD